jgi:hypothetical protein
VIFEEHMPISTVSAAGLNHLRRFSFKRFRSMPGRQLAYGDKYAQCAEWFPQDFLFD